MKVAQICLSSLLSPGAVWPGGECGGGDDGGEAGPESSAAAETTGGEFCSAPTHYQYIFQAI